MAELQKACFPASWQSNWPCEGQSLDALLYLDTTNLPSALGGRKVLVLCDTPVGASCGGSRFEYSFTGTLVDTIDPGVFGKAGWKAKLKDAHIGYCKACYTNAGLAEILQLNGPIENVEFLEDATDSQAAYATKKP